MRYNLTVTDLDMKQGTRQGRLCNRMTQNGQVVLPDFSQQLLSQLKAI